MPVTRTQLFAHLDQLGIAHQTRDHAPIFTVDEGRHIKAQMPGGHTKNLFLKDKKGALVLISALGDTVVRINRLHKEIGCARLSFGSAELLEDVLGVQPGSVTAFALLNDRETRVSFVLDAALLDHDVVNFHPLLNDATTAIASADLVRFAQSTGHEPRIIDFSRLPD